MMVSLYHHWPWYYPFLLPPTASPYPLPLVIPRCVETGTPTSENVMPVRCSLAWVRQKHHQSVWDANLGHTHFHSLPSSRTPNLDIKAPKKHHDWPNYTLRLQFHVQNHSDKQTAATNSAWIRQRMALNSSGDRAEWKSRLPQGALGVWWSPESQ